MLNKRAVPIIFARKILLPPHFVALHADAQLFSALLVVEFESKEE